MNICKKEVCTGCGSCINICRMQAVQMEQDEKGFFYPIIDNKKCTGCGLCKKVCPNNNVVCPTDIDIKPYAAWNKKSEIRNISSSGGVFTLLAEYILDLGGVVAGVKWDSNFHPKHCIIEQKEDIICFQGSKYAQSNCGSIYTEVKHYLELGRKVLFSGTPCQVHALKLYLGKKYESLFTVDLVCHGVPPAKMFDRYLEERNSGQKEITSINLRYKKPAWDYFSVNISFKNDKNYNCLSIADPYFNLFNFNYSLRSCCHSCRYTNLNRQGDITLSDFWGYHPESFRMSQYEEGVSGVLVNSYNGEVLFHAVKDCMMIEKSSIKKMILGNQCLEKPFKEPDDIDSFWDDYLSGMSIKELNDKYVTNPYTFPRFRKLRQLKRKYYWVWEKITKSEK